MTEAEKSGSEFPFAHVAIVGAGLIGSSVARAVKARTAARVTLIDQSECVCAQAVNLCIADHVSSDMTALGTADFVLIAVPVGAVGAVAACMADYLQPGAVVSDVGSVKAQIAADVAPYLTVFAEGVSGSDKPVFIPAHPVAGTEKSGPGAGFATLFEDRWCILTPEGGEAYPPQLAEAVDKVTRFWEMLGSKVTLMTAAHHDLVLAITSHVPHLIAYNIVGTASDLESVTESEVIKYSAGGFRDFTRIAASDPTMWRDVFLGNKDAVLEMLGRFSEDLSALQRAIRWGDGAALHDLFTRTRDIRNRVIDAGQDADLPDFGRPHVGHTTRQSAEQTPELLRTVGPRSNKED